MQNTDKLLALDIECYPNFFMIGVKNAFDPSEVHVFSTTRPEQRNQFYSLLNNLQNTFFTFNGNTYDTLMLAAYLYSTPILDPKHLKEVSDLIINSNLKPYKFTEATGIPTLNLPNHIDLMDVAPGQGSLKAYAARLHAKRLQDLPYDPDMELTNEQKLQVADYCINSDLDATILLYKALEKQINLRTQMSNIYGIDLRSKGDAPIAESVLVSELTKALHAKPSRPKKATREAFVIYDPPHYLTFHSEQLRHALAVVQGTQIPIASSGKLDLPKAISDLDITLNNTSYTLGIGGLHSCEKSQVVVPLAHQFLADFDVTSYYPSIILNNRLYPTHLTEAFLDVYKTIVDKRIAAKHQGDKTTANTLKIVINGSFGKFGSPYSILYSPKLLIQTTLTGQLSLLMLIEWLEAYGFSVKSGNTDGIVVLGHKENEPLLAKIIAKWEAVTQFEMERTDYKALLSRDVNNYIAIKPDGSTKTKGVYSTAGLQKNPETEICNEAMIKFLTKNIPFATTIIECNDVRKFISARAVRGGGVKDDRYLGKVVRWYYSTATETAIHYQTNGNKVPKSDKAMPIMDLPANNEVPLDLDRAAYIEICNGMLIDLGVVPKPAKVRKPRKKKGE